MPFRIEITEVTERPTVQRQWVRIADTGNTNDGGAMYDYATYPSTEKFSRAVLTQEVETLDLGAVIRAVNNL